MYVTSDSKQGIEFATPHSNFESDMYGDRRQLT